MHVPIIFTLNAADNQSGPYPAITADARIMFDNTEQNDKTEFLVDNIECTDYLPKRTEVVYWLNVPAHETWRVNITNSRITFENPYSKGIIGGAKVKNGRLTAGHLSFDAIAYLSTFFSKEGFPILLCCCYRQDGTKSAILMHGNNKDTMRSMLSLLQERIMTYLNVNGKLATASDTEQTKLDEAMHKWSKIAEQSWNDIEGSCTVVVPNKAYKEVSNSRLS